MIKDLEYQKQILKGQCINICCNGVRTTTIKDRIALSKELYYEILKSDYYNW